MRNMSNPLGELVTAHCERTGESLSEVAARGGISRQTLSGLVNRHGPKAFPREATLEGLAKGLGVSFERVRQSAAESAYGHSDEATQRRMVGVLVAYAESLTDDELEVVLATVRALKKLASSA